MPLPLLNILIADDDQGDRRKITRALKQVRLPCHCTETTSIAQAIEACEKSSFDCAIIDYRMPGQNGLDAISILHEKLPQLAIIMSTGHGDEMVATRAMKRGALDYIPKNAISGKALKFVIEKTLREKELAAERERNERQLIRQANNDELTGLSNRRCFVEYMQQELNRAIRWARTEALMFLDVNGFKAVNDTLGHEVGDKLLQEIALRLKGSLRSGDRLARYAGDEFVIHLDADSHVSEKTCAGVAGKIAASFHDPVCIGNHVIKTSVSIGIAFFPEHGSDFAQLIRSADQAMYQAKKTGKGIALATHSH